MRPSVPLALFLAASCGPLPQPASVRESAPASVPSAASSDEAVLARLAKERGVLDLAAEHARRAYENKKTADAKRAWGVALADAWAFERAREVLADFPEELAKVPDDSGNVAPPHEVIDRVLVALGRRDGKTAREAIAPLVTPRASPLVLELAGRARLLLKEPIEARRMFARARSRIDASGAHIGMLATAAGAVETIAERGGRIFVGRARERYLTGGYQSNGTHSMWIESYAPGDAEPLLRWRTGHFRSLSVSLDGNSIAIADTPISDGIVTSSAPQTTARLFDANLGRETSSFPTQNVRSVDFGPSSELLVSDERDVLVTDAFGRVARTLAITGVTPTIVRGYSTHPNRNADAITSYPSRATSVAYASDGAIAVGASDGNIWVWPSGNKPSFVLKPLPDPAPRDPTIEPHDRQPLVMRFVASTLVSASADGAVTSWDLATRKSKTLVQPKCTEQEFGHGVWATAPMTPDVLARCAESRNAGISGDGSRAVFAGMMSGARIRDAKSGDAVSMLDTLESDAIEFDDASGKTAWLGGVSGTIEHWNTTTGERIESLAQGGVAGFIQTVSEDGRYVSVMEASTGFHQISPPRLIVWDTTAHAVAPNFPSDASLVKFLSGSVAQITTRAHGSAVFDVATNQRLFDLAPDEWSVMVSDSHERYVSLRSRQKIVVRDTHGALREIDAGGHVDVLAIDRGARVVAALTDGGATGMTGEVAVWSIDDGRELFRIPAMRGSTLAVSPDGRAIATSTDGKTIVVTQVDDHHEIARITTKDLSPAQDYSPMRAVAFASENDLLVVGPGEPGFERLYRWRIGQKSVATDLQILSGGRIEISPAGIATLYDRNDSAHLVRASDGVLLASVYATLGGGFLVMSREGAVDASSPEGQAAAVTNIDGQILAGRSSWLGWDRFAVSDLLSRASRGELVAPPMPALIDHAVSLQATR